jgi:hypothetical protein
MAEPGLGSFHIDSADDQHGGIQPAQIMKPEIGAALGRSRQALWQRAASRSEGPKAAQWEALGKLLAESWATSAEVRH